MLVTVLALHVLAAIAAPFLGRRLGRDVLLVCGLAPLATSAVAIAYAGQVLGGDPVTQQIAWAPALGLDVELRLDAFGLLMVALVSGIGTLVFAYARWYFSDRPDLGKFGSLLVAFAGAMLGLVLADNLLVVYLFWELTSITSYLLIGFEDRKASARAAALQALLTTAMGGLAMLGGFVLIGQAAGTYQLSALLAAPPSGTVVDVAVVLVLIGAFAKSAQFPFHAWLPGAMAAPTPVSAYLHSATMVKAGVYLIARLAPAFAEVTTTWRPLVLTVGLLTMLLGGWRALRQLDLKLTLAFGTISQLGFLTVLVGAGYPEATLAGTAVLFAHGLFKAALFMVTGVIDHETGTRDVRRLSGLGRRWPVVAGAATIAAASMAGIPPLLGFVSKELAYEAFVGESTAVLAGLVAGSVLTFAYSARYVRGAFGTKEKPPRDVQMVDLAEVHAPAPAFVGPSILLAGLTVVFGLVPGLLDGLVVGAAQVLDARVPGDEYLALWHGVNTALLLSLATMALGALMFALRRQVSRFQSAMPRPPDATDVYQSMLRGTLVGAERLTGVVQNGSLPVYLAVILVTVLAVPGSALVLQPTPIGEVVPFESASQAVVALLMGISAVAVVLTRSRFAAVLCLGGVGYGVALLFVLQGAPDLALTQLLVETLTVVLFVLFLRHLPKRFTNPTFKFAQVPRAAIAVAFGVFAAFLTLVAVSARDEVTPSGQRLAATSMPDGGGANVVNVILADFRAFDTLGEIVVLTVTALGVIGLIRAARRDRQRGLSEAGKAPDVWFRSSPILDAGIRATFRLILLFGVFLLFSGHNLPGGGFIGGLVIASAFVLAYVAAGPARLRRDEPLAPEVLLGTGVTLSTASGVLGWVMGGDFLYQGSTGVPVPGIGELYLSSAVLFEVGVALVVVGLVLAILRSIGREGVHAA